MRDAAEELPDIMLAHFYFLFYMANTELWRSDVLIRGISPKFEVNNINGRELLSDVRILHSPFSAALQVIAFNLEFFGVFHGAHLESHLWLRGSRGRLGLALDVLLGIRRICLEQPQARGCLNVEDLIIIRLHLQDPDLEKSKRDRRLLISELNLFDRCVDCGVGCSRIPKLLLESSSCLLSLIILFFNHFDVVHYRL